MNDTHARNAIEFDIGFSDEHLIELNATVADGLWGGHAQAYTTAQQIIDFARDLVRFANSLDHPSEFAAGADNGIGLIALRFYTLDRAGHVACHVQLASNGSGQRREDIARLAIEVRVEPASMLRFANELHRLAVRQIGKAILVSEIRA